MQVGSQFMSIWCLFASGYLKRGVSTETQGCPSGNSGEESSCNAGDTGDWVPFLCWEDPLEKGMTTHSSILAWRIPWPEEPGGLQSMGSQSHTQLRQLRMQACTVETKETNDSNKKCLEWTLSPV